MIKFKVYVKSNNAFYDDDVFVEIELPAIPPIGSAVILSDELRTELENKAKSSLEIARRYAPDWFYCNSRNIKDVRQENLEDLSFDDVAHVMGVLFTANSEFIEMELGNM